MNNKKAEMGIGTLIIFIAMILVAAIAAGVLLQTASSLQNKALLTGERSKSQVSTSVSVLQVFGEHGDEGSIERFCGTMKLQPGSDPIKLADLLINFDTDNTSTNYNLGNTTTLGEINGTAETSLVFDYDNDGTYDNITVDSSGEAIIIQVSNSSSAENVSINITKIFDNDNGNYFNMSESYMLANYTTARNISLFQADVNDSASSQWGSISIIGWDVITAANNSLNGSGVYFYFARASDSDGVTGYSVSYLVQGSSYTDGYLNRGDVVRICGATPRQISEDEDVSITFVPKTGTITTVETVLPEIFSQQRVYIYP